MRNRRARALASWSSLLVGLVTVACGGDGGAGSGAPGGSGGSGAGSGAEVPKPFEGPSTGTARLDCNGHGCAVTQIALGTIAACALLEDRTVACYGGGIVGTLGRAERPEIDPVPQRVPGLQNVASIHGGGYTMCAVLADKTVTCWGADQSANPYGARPGERFVVEGLAGVVDLAVATSHTCARVESGDVYCFGSNYFGELGDGTTDNARRAVRAAVSGVRHVTTGAEISCAVLADGSVACWGMNDLGQLGQSEADKLVHPAPVTVPGLPGAARSVSASSISGAVCALLEDGTTRCWGEKLPGAGGATGATSLAVGWNHACAVVAAGGAVSCWGSNTKGQLGDGSLAPYGEQAVLASGVHQASGLVTGGGSSCVVLASGAFACWGDDSRGQLGSGAKGTTRAAPAQTHF